MSELQQIIEAAFEDRAHTTPANVEPAVKRAVDEAIELLDSGKARVAEPCDGGWQVNEWLKKAVLLSFRIRENAIMSGGSTQYYDKVFCQYRRLCR
jgi:2,3,4,5-tetrahydropyridine-2-carboxylate N-succinyltransferase